VCCSVLQCVLVPSLCVCMCPDGAGVVNRACAVVCCSVLQCVAVCSAALQCVQVRCSVLQCVEFEGRI